MSARGRSGHCVSAATVAVWHQLQGRMLLVGARCCCWSCLGSEESGRECRGHRFRCRQPAVVARRAAAQPAARLPPCRPSRRLERQVAAPTFRCRRRTCACPSHACQPSLPSRRCRSSGCVRSRGTLRCSTLLPTHPGRLRCGCGKDCWVHELLLPRVGCGQGCGRVRTAGEAGP
jgi:hypothetical protein